MAQAYADNQPNGYKNYIENVAIIGAGGRIGRHITQALLKAGKHKITAITRQDSTSIVPADVIVKKVDYNDQASLIEALKGQDVLIITMSVMAPPEEQTKLIDAAAAAGVPWVLPNEFGGDPFEVQTGKDQLLGERKAKYREHIEELGKSSWIGIVNGFWYEFSLGGGVDRYGFDFKNRTVTLLDNGKVKINTSTFPQVGRGVAALLNLKILPDNKDDKSPYLASFKNNCAYISSFTIAQEDMLKSVLRVTGTTLSDWKITHTTAKEYFKSGQELFIQGKMEGFGRLLYARAFFPESNGNFEATKGLHNDILGLPQENLDVTKISIGMSDEIY
ncbi:hypothetical protein BGX28_000224 [Mortierella sp. GBA30]|nr:hypothetical protein BGX28_000224 [Mortierella sp. GBA30]